MLTPDMIRLHVYTVNPRLAGRMISVGMTKNCRSSSIGQQPASYLKIVLILNLLLSHVYIFCHSGSVLFEILISGLKEKKKISAGS